MYDDRGYIMPDGYGCDGMVMMMMMEVAMAMVSHDDVWMKLMVMAIMVDYDDDNPS